MRVCEEYCVCCVRGMRVYMNACETVGAQDFVRGSDPRSHTSPSQCGHICSCVHVCVQSHRPLQLTGRPRCFLAVQTSRSSCLLTFGLILSCVLLSSALCSCLLMFAHVCSCLLMFAHVCSCVLMFAHVCSCLLMFAHICSWPHG